MTTQPGRKSVDTRCEKECDAVRVMRPAEGLSLHSLRPDCARKTMHDFRRAVTMVFGRTFCRVRQPLLRMRDPVKDSRRSGGKHGGRAGREYFSLDFERGMSLGGLTRT